MLTIKNKGLELKETINHKGNTFVYLTALERVAIESETKGNTILKVEVYASEPVFNKHTCRYYKNKLDDYFYIKV